MTDQKAEQQATAPQGLALMRAPFADHHISKLPKESKAQADQRKENSAYGINCLICGGWHHKHAVHLDYVGHAAITHRLLDVDPNWSWEPMALRDGLPALDANGGLWIRLTVCGVTRIGYGDAPNKKGGDAMKEAIGDAIRNAAMRFGAALDLWHKGDLYGDDEQAGEGDGKRESKQPAGQQQPAQPAEKPAYPKADFDKNFPTWSKAIANGKKTHADVIAMIETKAPLTDEQKSIINAVKVTAKQQGA